MPKLEAHWRMPLLQLLLLAALMLWAQWSAASSMAALWWRSDTFAHALLVPPIALWLIWRRRAELAPLQPKTWWPGLLALAAAVLLASVGRLAEVNVLQHFGVVFTLQALVLTLLGPAICGRIAFPLLFLWFAPPFGEFLMQPMMEQTADFVVWGLKLIGIPVFREGLQFIIPSGNWSVVEACSGVRYLFASFMVGTLFAYLNFQRWPSRLGFMLVSLLVPVLANWLRALIIVLLGHYSSNRIATGADHLVYGWLFFGLIMMIMFWIGGRWADLQPLRAEAPLPAAPPAARPATVPGWSLPLLAALMVALPGRWAAALHEQQPLPLPAQALADLRPAGDWQLIAVESTPWQPSFMGEPLKRQSRWQTGGSAAVVLDIAVYPRQHGDDKAVNSMNQLVRNGDPVWIAAGAETLAGPDGEMRQTRWRMRQDSLLERQHLARRVYWVDGRFTASEREAKWLGLKQLVAGRGDAQAMLVLMTADEGDGGARLDAFWRDIRTPLNERLQALAREAAGHNPRR